MIVLAPDDINEAAVDIIEPGVAAAPRLPASDFGCAINWLKNGLKVSRRGWNGEGQWLHAQRVDAGSKMTQPYIFMRTTGNHLVPWTASQTDLFAEDWFIVQ